MSNISNNGSGEFRGKVFLVGAGPGDIGLLTVKARELIGEADALIYDYLVNPKLLDWCKPSCEKIYVGKKPGMHSVTQEEIQDIIVDRARKHECVVRLKGGDPFIFGRGGEEAKRLVEGGFEFEIVPGVTAALAGAAYAGIPLTRRDLSSSICFLTGHENPEKNEFRVDFEKFAKVGGTLCIYMGMGGMPNIVSDLLSGGLPANTPAAAVQWASLPRQRCVRATLGTLEDEVRAAGLKAPAIIYVGPTVVLDEPISWFEEKPLFGKRIVITRSRDRASNLREQLTAVGAEVLEIPLIRSCLSHNKETTDEVFEGMGSYDWIVFTSANGVECFFKLFYERFQDLRSIGLLRIACVGRTTAEAVEEQRLKVDLIPEENTGAALAHKLKTEESIENIKILVVTGNLNREDVVDLLSDAGAIVDKLPVYKTELVDLEDNLVVNDFRTRGANAVVFASSSAVHSFAKQAGALQLAADAEKPLGCSFGPMTSEAMKKIGMPVDIQAKTPNVASIVEALIERLGKV